MAVTMDVPLFFCILSGNAGMIATVIPEKTACIRCIFPISPEKEKGTPILGAGSITNKEVSFH
jgi:molybdopterin/thiamine biosynthesis adenylyltransferase